MDKQIITFSANEQNLVRIGGECHYSSNKVSYIEAHFDLGANWDGFDSVRAVWFTDRINGISTVLDGEGNCTVPTEVLKKKDRVFVNLVGSIVSNGELTDRLTTYPAVALVVDSKAKVDSTETAPVTPSQFEQFVSIVQDAVANIKDIVSTTLNADYTLTFVYSDGTSYTTPSIRGERGPQGADGADGTDGNGIASAVLNSNYTLTLTFTDGTSYTTPSIRGAQGPKGDPGDVSQAQLDAAVSDLKSDISDIENNTFPELFGIGADLTVTQTIDGYGLLANGRRAANASYAIDIYALSLNSVSEGDLLYLKLSADTAGVCQFQNDGGIPVNYDNPYLVGGVYTSALDGFIAVPQGASHLIISRNADRTDDIVAKTTSKIDDINAEIVVVKSVTDDFETHLIGENLVNSDELEVGYYYLKGVKSSSAAMTSAWINVDGISVINASGMKIANSTWSGVEMYYICSYDADKNYINGSMDNSGVRQYTVPSGAKYLTVSYVNTTYSDFTVVAGTKRPVRYVNSVEKTILMPSHYGEWFGKKWAAMGDSLTEYNDRNTKNYIEYISEATGITPVNLGVSGTGYRRGVNNNNSFYNRVNTIPSDCNVLTIFGSFNDLGDDQILGTISDDISDDTVFGYVNATLDAIYTAIPTINIGIIAPTPWKANRPWDDTETGSLYVNGLKQICYNRGIPFLDLYHCSNLRPWDATARNSFYSNDVVGGVNAGCHPDSAGHKMIAPKIKNFLDSLII